MTDRKKPTAGFWIIVALVAVLAYPISFGPACWLLRVNFGWFSTVAAVYHPIIRFAATAPPSVRRTIEWYSGGQLPRIQKELIFAERKRRADEGR